MISRPGIALARVGGCLPRVRQRTPPVDYTQRINRVVDLVVEHLDEDISLERLAAAACFSPFHFHRLFQSLTGESVKAFTQRVRLERALVLLKANPRLSLKEVAAACGFGSPAVFSRAFRRVYHRAPGEVELPAFLQERKNRQAFPIASRYYLRKFPADEPPMPVTVETFPARPIAYLRATNSYLSKNVPRAFARMFRWADARGVTPENARLIGLGWNDPEVTPLRQCSYDVALQLPAGVAPHADFSRRVIPAGKFAVCRCTGDIHVVDKAWNYLFKVWLPHSRWQPANFPALEVFVAWPRDPQWATWDLEACVPLAPL